MLERTFIFFSDRKSAGANTAGEAQRVDFSRLSMRCLSAPYHAFFASSALPLNPQWEFIRQRPSDGDCSSRSTAGKPSGSRRSRIGIAIALGGSMAPYSGGLPEVDTAHRESNCKLFYRRSGACCSIVLVGK